MLTLQLSLGSMLNRIVLILLMEKKQLNLIMKRELLLIAILFIILNY